MNWHVFLYGNESISIKSVEFLIQDLAITSRSISSRLPFCLKTIAIQDLPVRWNYFHIMISRISSFVLNDIPRWAVFLWCIKIHPCRLSLLQEGFATPYNPLSLLHGPISALQNQKHVLFSISLSQFRMFYCFSVRFTLFLEDSTEGVPWNIESSINLQLVVDYFGIQGNIS